jgi:predicted MPP superfamily phosphohydrolase
MTSKRYIWLTDLHLDFLDNRPVREFCETVLEKEPDGIIITGDISVASELIEDLGFLVKCLGLHTYFVLGNHDFYYGWKIEDVRKEVKNFCDKHPFLTYLTDDKQIELHTDTVLIGHDSWGDCRNGNVNSELEMSDFNLIFDLKQVKDDVDARNKKLNELGDQAAEYLKKQITIAVEKYDNIIIAMHVPPFPESAWYRNRHSDVNFMPFFSCKAVGDMLLDISKENPNKQLTILCGHTHGEGEYKPLPNLLVKTGMSDYYQPNICGIIELGAKHEGY